MVVEDLSAGKTHTPSDFRLLFANAGLSTALQLAEHYIGFVQFIDPEHFPNVDVYAEKGSGFDTVVGIGLHELSPGELLDDETPFFTRSGDVNQESPCRRALPAIDRSERGLWLSGTLMTPNCQASSHDNDQSREQSDQSARALSQKSEPDWHSISEYAAVWQVRLTLRLMTDAESPVRDRRDRAE
jgi:hypothetical protein